MHGFRARPGGIGPRWTWRPVRTAKLDTEQLRPRACPVAHRRGSAVNRRRRLTTTRPEPVPRSRPRRLPLAAGQLRAMVLAHLRAHPHLDFSPAELANVLNRPTSRGAIANACRRLIEDGLATRTRQQPQRYRAV